jgi:uncharacterized coiled-coil protein SlyX
MNREQGGFSRKYPKGAVHELATGKFEILDRYKEDNRTLLEYKWLTGEKAGQVEINKEININASLHKFRVSRNRPTIQPFEPSVEKIDQVLEIVKSNQTYLDELDHQIKHMNVVIEAQQEVIKKMDDQIRRLVDNHNLVTSQQNLLNKLFDKL